MREKPQLNDVADALFSMAWDASRAELKRAMRDPVLWIEQALEFAFAFTKVICIALAAALVVMWLTNCAARPAVCFTLYPSIVVAAFNPRDFFWRNLFIMRAAAAFDNALRNSR